MVAQVFWTRSAFQSHPLLVAIDFKEATSVSWPNLFFGGKDVVKDNGNRIWCVRRWPPLDVVGEFIPDYTAPYCNWGLVGLYN